MLGTEKVYVERGHGRERVALWSVRWRSYGKAGDAGVVVYRSLAHPLWAPAESKAAPLPREI